MPPQISAPRLEAELRELLLAIPRNVPGSARVSLSCPPHTFPPPRAPTRSDRHHVHAAGRGPVGLHSDPPAKARVSRCWPPERSRQETRAVLAEAATALAGARDWNVLRDLDAEDGNGYPALLCSYTDAVANETTLPDGSAGRRGDPGRNGGGRHGSGGAGVRLRMGSRLRLAGPQRQRPGTRQWSGALAACPNPIGCASITNRIWF
jgi:hypothetical protein